MNRGVRVLRVNESFTVVTRTVVLLVIAASSAVGCAARSPRSVRPPQAPQEVGVQAAPGPAPPSAQAPMPAQSPSQQPSTPPPPPPSPPHHTTLHWPRGAEWGQSLLTALRAPRTWVPAAAAVAVIPWDHKISDWATSHTPIFGSIDNAQKASGDLLGVAELGMVATAIAEPGGDAWWRSRFNRFLVEYSATSMANLTTSGLKAAFPRNRPDDSGDDSFPSAHSTRAFASATMASVNLAGTPMPQGLRIGLDAGITTFAAGTAWARVEAGRHFPTDVLAGAAVGSLVSTW